ncbi:MAG: nucleoside 2-deoxyribosyltransferase [Pseudomonadota bacterium]
MKIYLAARFSRRHEAHALGARLQALGHTITSRWSLPDSDHVKPAGMSEQAADKERERFALEDVEDVRAADCCISLMEPPRGNGRGGRHVEFGIALALGHRMIIIGPRETVFHHLPEVEHFGTPDQLVDFLSSELLETAHG